MCACGVCTLFGCPSEVVNSYFSEIKNGENADLANYLLENVETQSEDTEKETKEDPKMEEAMKIYLSKLNVEVLSESIDGDKATVEVDVSGLNLSNIILDILQESLSNAFSGTEITDEYMSNSILEKVNSGKEETRTGTISLSKVDKEWKINTDDESFMGLILGKAQGFNDKGL